MSSSSTSYISPSSSSYLSPIEAAAGRRHVPPLVLPADSSSSPHERDPPSHTSGFFPSRSELPRIVWNFDPIIKVKLRKRFYPLGVTRLTLGADFDIRTYDVAFKWSWKDRILGGRLEFVGNQIALTKRFDIDHRSKLDVRAAYDLHMKRTLFSLNVRPFRGVIANEGPHPGLTIKQKIPIDQRVAVQFEGRLSVPEARFSNETTTAVSLGEGDFVFDMNRLDFKFMLQ